MFDAQTSPPLSRRGVASRAFGTLPLAAPWRVYREQRPAPAEAAAARAGLSIEVRAGHDVPADEWRAVEADYVLSGYLRYDWVRAWTRHLVRRRERFIVVTGRRHGRPLFFLPLIVGRVGPWRVARWVGRRDANLVFGAFTTAALVDGLLPPSEQLLREIARAAGIDVFALSRNLQRLDGHLNPLAAAPGLPHSSGVRSLELLSSGAATLSACRSRASLKTLKKKFAALERMGTLTYRVASNGAEAAALLDAFLAQKAAQLDGRRERHEFRDPAVAAFLREAGFAPDDAVPALEVHALVLDDAPIAIFGGVPHRLRMSGMILSAAGGAVSRHSPGEVLIARMLENLSERGFRTLDFGYGESEYKARWCHAQEAVFDIRLAMRPHAAPLAWGMARLVRLRRYLRGADAAPAVLSAAKAGALLGAGLSSWVGRGRREAVPSAGAVGGDQAA